MDEKASFLLRALPSLDSIKLMRYCGDMSFQEILEHGTLRRLCILPGAERAVRPFVMTREKIDSILAYCPRIEDLTVSIPRTNGDFREVEIHRALAQMPRLKKLEIFFDCSGFYDWRKGGSSLQPTSPLGYADIQDILINASIYEPLIYSIFRTIIEASAREFPPLQRLKAVIFDFGNLGVEYTADLDAIVQFLFRKWQCIQVQEMVMTTLS
ncbi:hypothetical protein CIRG_00899 [Coccidioides immitis RMSCC 2394]|uniref:F-box domain containing protein n=1 Tax=Coccidioides immitis RMSCC 2394 TaxID=404692 RepID=A0A0J7ATY2_COCIT|nr:hypothetical protein CIRG_00899 [Coccidioides immitis RMSCC 2394]